MGKGGYWNADGGFGGDVEPGGLKFRSGEGFERGDHTGEGLSVLRTLPMLAVSTAGPEDEASTSGPVEPVEGHLSCGGQELCGEGSERDGVGLAAPSPKSSRNMDPDALPVRLALSARICAGSFPAKASIGDVCIPSCMLYE